MDERLIDESASLLGYTLKEEQRKIIVHFVGGEDVFGVLPTGFGKSLCYQCLPFVFDSKRDDGLSSLILVITPLIAIMKDQVVALKQKGLRAGYVCGEDDDSSKDIKDGHVQFQLIFFTPESLLMKRRYRKIICSDEYQKRIRGLIIDEAHTVKKWGSTFRESLLRIGEIRSIIPENIPVMALTATATHSLRTQLAEIIGMKKPAMVILSPCKSNLMYSVSKFISIDENFSQLAQKLKKERTFFPRTVIYCTKMVDCADLYLFFEERLGRELTEPIGAPSLSQYRLVEMFTSCTDDDIKDQIIASFTKPSVLRIVCATVAFGMGVNCSDVHTVIHLGAPDNIEAYIQETGRAGRDGLPAKAILLTKTRSLQYINNDMKAYCLSTNCCRREFLFSRMEGYIHSCHSVLPKDCCDVCAGTTSTND